MAVELALNVPGAIIRYAALTSKSASEIVTATLKECLATCPEELLPEINEIKGTVTWPNGSILTWAGTDNDQFDRLRGPKCHLILLDESAFYAKLKEVESALLPQLTTTGGKVLYLSTPPENPGHEFVQRYYAAAARGMAQHDTLLNNPRLSEDRIKSFLGNEADRLGLPLTEFVASTYCRREYFAEIVTEESKAAIPSFTPERAREIVRERERPIHFDGYVSLDLGLIDGHGVLFAYWDYARAKLVVEDEILLRGKTTDILTEAVKQKETALWGNDKFNGTLFGAKDWGSTPEWLKGVAAENAPRQPYLRVADNELIVLADMHSRHGLSFFPTPKDEKHMAVDALDIAIRTGQVEIHPRCVKLIHQLYSTLWDNNRRQWERTADGHGELVDCFVAGTMIRVADGERRIEDLRRGDMVWTRQGLKPVVKAAQTKTKAPIWRLTVSDGTQLLGTSEHPVMTQHGWVPLSQLTPECMLREWNQSISSGAEGDGSGTLTENKPHIGTTTDTRYGNPKPISMWQSGRRRMAQFLQGMSSTILTTIRSITPSRTSLACPPANTCAIMPVTQNGLSSRETSPSRQPSALRWYGTALTPEGSGTASMPRRSGRTPISLVARALFAATSTKQRKPIREPAEGHVSPNSVANQDSTTSRLTVRSAEGHLRRTSIQRLNPAPLFVVSVEPTGEEASVYNLAVDECPEYWANGILVHNCMVYLWRNVRKNRDPRPAPPVDEFAKAIAAMGKRTETTFGRKFGR